VADLKGADQLKLDLAISARIEMGKIEQANHTLAFGSGKYGSQNDMECKKGSRPSTISRCVKDSDNLNWNAPIADHSQL
jgi:hypothetical protein